MSGDRYFIRDQNAIYFLTLITRPRLKRWPRGLGRACLQQAGMWSEHNYKGTFASE